jgi:hypothetical protein
MVNSGLTFHPRQKEALPRQMHGFQGVRHRDHFSIFSASRPFRKSSGRPFCRPICTISHNSLKVSSRSRKSLGIHFIESFPEGPRILALESWCS